MGFRKLLRFLFRSFSRGGLPLGYIPETWYLRRLSTGRLGASAGTIAFYASPSSALGVL